MVHLAPPLILDHAKVGNIRQRWDTSGKTWLEVRINQLHGILTYSARALCVHRTSLTPLIFDETRTDINDATGTTIVPGTIIM